MKDNNSVLANWNYIIIAIIFFVTIAMLVMYMPGLREIDVEILKTIRKFLGQFPNYIPVFFSNYCGTTNFWWPQISVGAVLISHHKYLKTFLLVFFIQALFWVIEIIKNIVCRDRPSIYPGYSFPSGHAAVHMCFWGIVIYLIMKYVKNSFWRITLSIIFGLSIFMVALSRLWLGVHFLTDVLAGLFLGFAFANLYIVLDKFFTKN